MTKCVHRSRRRPSKRAVLAMNRRYKQAQTKKRRKLEAALRRLKAAQSRIWLEDVCGMYGVDPNTDDAREQLKTINQRVVDEMCRASDAVEQLESAQNRIWLEEVCGKYGVDPNADDCREQLQTLIPRFRRPRSNR